MHKQQDPGSLEVRVADFPCSLEPSQQRPAAAHLHPAGNHAFAADPGGTAFDPCGSGGSAARDARLAGFAAVLGAAQVAGALDQLPPSPAGGAPRHLLMFVNLIDQLDLVASTVKTHKPHFCSAWLQVSVNNSKWILQLTQVLLICMCQIPMLWEPRNVGFG